MDRETRHQLKTDEFKDTVAQIEEYFRQHYKEVLTGLIAVIVVLGLIAGLKYYSDRQAARANADLGEALSTFRAYVGPPTPGQPPSASNFASAQEKYKKALQQFDAIINNYKMVPRPKAVAVARYQAGVCQSLLGDHEGAIRTLTDASLDRDADIASLAKFALAGEMAATGKTSEAAKLYQILADHPTLTVPKASALLALADAYRESNPALSRQTYERVEKEYADDPTIAQAVKQQMATLMP